MPPDVERVAALMDNLSAQRAPEVRLCSRAHPRGALVFQPQ
jgi:hypothetical protein